ncbi:hypothetical protein MLD38_006943 [Melastoma candidum]|uniref:Uncharacterized protein n=1 Tax=Melastoma candidum TaxID=119954 RepID=A0ACB9RQ28_9MYRT|nr:hypothetical protein MLD38_006943 [Melastoma candidum]
MDSKPIDRNGPAPRKVRFAPKAPPSRKPNQVKVKTEVKDDVDMKDEDAKAKDLIRHLNENILKDKPKIERKVAASQIAFGYGGITASSKYQKDRTAGYGQQGASPSGLREEKEYREPWDYYSYYPVTLPLRKIYSGDPELLDEDEFGESSSAVDYDENRLNSAVELGLAEDSSEARMFFLQLPPSVPMTKRPSSSVQGESSESSNPPNPSDLTGATGKVCCLSDLPAGFMGKMLVYKSGAIKLKLGTTLYDVSSGMDCVFAQDVMAINTSEKHCCVLGELTKHAIVTPDVDSILESVNDL